MQTNGIKPSDTLKRGQMPTWHNQRKCPPAPKQTGRIYENASNNHVLHFCCPQLGHQFCLAGGRSSQPGPAQVRFVSEVRFSPDGKQLAYTVSLYDYPGWTYSQLWLTDAAGRSPKRVGGDKDELSHPRWSPDG